MTYTTTTTTTSTVVDALTGVKTTTTTVTTTVVETPVVEEVSVELSTDVRMITGSFNGLSVEVSICKDWDGREEVKVSSDSFRRELASNGIYSKRNDEYSYSVAVFNSISRFLEDRKFFTFDKIKGDYVELA